MNINAENDEWYRLDIRRIAAECRVEHVCFEETVSSTNDWAIRSAHSAASSRTTLFLANRQTGGRGRGSNRWVANQGSLTFTLSIDETVLSKDFSRMLLPLAVGCGVIDVLTHRGIEAKIKWPNDVYHQDQKLAGILVETASSGSRLVIGCGVNVNNDCASVQNAISLRMACGKGLPITEIAIAFVNGILGRIESDSVSGSNLLAELRNRDWLQGRSVKWTQGGSTQTGVAIGISDDGGLQLSTSNGAKTVYSGSIQPLPKRDGDECREIET